MRGAQGWADMRYRARRAAALTAFQFVAWALVALALAFEWRLP